MSWIDERETGETAMDKLPACLYARHATARSSRLRASLTDETDTVGLDSNPPHLCQVHPHLLAPCQKQHRIPRSNPNQAKWTLLVMTGVVSRQLTAGKTQNAAPPPMHMKICPSKSAAGWILTYRLAGGLKPLSPDHEAVSCQQSATALGRRWSESAERSRYA